VGVAEKIYKPWVQGQGHAATAMKILWTW